MSSPPPEDQPATASDPWTAPPPAAPPAVPPGGQPGVPAAYAQPGYPAPAYPPNLSSAGKRFGAFLLDIVLAIVTLGIGWLIWTLIVWKDGQSPAKQILHMRIISAETGQAIDWGKSFLRNFVCYGLIGIIPLVGPIYRIVGACFVFNDNRQALWDRMVSTYVIDES
jgi:uncharacterized RDD family membrane protein YckC